MKIAVRGGHNSQSIGAVGILNEYVEDRKVCSAVIKYLKQMGHDARDVSPGPMNTNSDLVYGVNQASNMGAEVFISIHFNKAYNSYNGAIGTEAYVHSANRNRTDGQIATRIVNSLGNAGFRNRGVKSNDELYEMHSTKARGMIAVLIEVCFVEATEDVAVYNKLGADHIGRLIAQAIVNQTTSASSNSTSNNTVSTGGEFKAGAYSSSVVTTSDLNVRAGRGTEHAVIGSLKKGTVITVNYILPDNHDGVGDSSLWGSISYEGKTGYIHLGYTNPANGSSTGSSSVPTQKTGEYLIKSYPEQGQGTVICSKLNVRSGHTTEIDNVVDYYLYNGVFYYDSVYITNKYVYCSYISTSGVRRYIAVRDQATGERFATCT